LTRWRLTLSVGALLTFCIAAPPAWAQVFADPDSPAGKEYAIPLEKARRDAGAPARGDNGGGSVAGGRGSSADNSGGGPGSGNPARELFGVGITRKAGERSAGADRTPQQSGVRPPVGGAAAAAEAPDGSAALTTGGIVLAALLGGGALGLLLRRGLRS